MQWATKRRLKDATATLLIVAEAANVVQMARRSDDGALRRASKVAFVGASAAAMVGGGIGFADAKLNPPYDRKVRDRSGRTLEVTVVTSGVSAIAAGLTGGIASLVWGALRGKRRLP